MNLETDLEHPFVLPGAGILLTFRSSFEEYVEILYRIWSIAKELRVTMREAVFDVTARNVLQLELYMAMKTIPPADAVDNTTSKHD